MKNKEREKEEPMNTEEREGKRRRGKRIYEQGEGRKGERGEGRRREKG